MSIRNLELMFRPASVAVIGASSREGSVGSVVLRNLRQGGFRGPVWPVNRRRVEVLGAQAWPDVESLPGPPDLAVICTPAHTVAGLVAELGRKGTRAAIVLTAGLKQQGEGGTMPMEQAMLNAAKPYLLRILGPNCIGALVPGVGLNGSFAPGNALPGTLAFVTQSGALATAMLDWANERGIGFSHFISLGDSADVDFGDVLDYLASDPGTRAILMYVESVTAARKFMSAARAASRNKPVIVVKAGRTPAAAKAAASHTGALAGSDVVFDAAARRAGILRVDTLEALFDAAETLAWPHSWHGDNVAVLTNGGGAGVLAADALAAAGGKLAALSEATLRALGDCLPHSWSRGNPVDIIGDAPVKRYSDALSVLLAAPEVDGVIFMHAPTAIVSATDIAAGCIPVIKGGGKPVLTCWLGGTSVQEARKAFVQEGLPWYSTPERAAAAWLQLADYHRNQAAVRELAAADEGNFAVDGSRGASVVDGARAAGQEWLDPSQAQELLQAYGIAAVPTVMAHDAQEAAAQSISLGFPAALKIVSPQIIHKSDVGGVALDLGTASEVELAAVKMRQRVSRLKPEAVVRGFAVQAMARRPNARELIAGIATDPLFGPVILLGLGGRDVEIHGQHAVALPPLNRALAADLITRSGLRPLLAAHRGAPAADEDAVVDTLLKLSRLACEQAGVSELDINPLLVDSAGTLAVDARARVVLQGERQRLAICAYPRELDEQVRLGDSELALRPIRPEDGERLALFYAHAEPEDLRLRFFMARREVPRSELARYSQIDYDREMTFIALAPGGQDGAAPVMVGEVRGVCDPDNQRAEFSLQVASEWQGRGLARTLLDKLVSYLRSRGTLEIVGQCLVENKRMASLARRAGFAVENDQASGTMALRMVLRNGL